MKQYTKVVLFMTIGTALLGGLAIKLFMGETWTVSLGTGIGAGLGGGFTVYYLGRNASKNNDK